MMDKDSKVSSFLLQFPGGGQSLALPALLTLFFVLGIGIRLYDLTDPPFDFNPTRQFRGAILARGLYYQMLPDADPVQRELAVSLTSGYVDYEPLILERVMAVIYLLTGEHFWVARIVNSLIWCWGGWFLFQLARRAGSLDGALLALGFYLFLPFSVYASRSFQPDPLMTMWIVLTIYAAYLWEEERSWRWALGLGILGGMAALTKIFAAFFIAGMMLALVLGVVGLRQAFKDRQLWTVAVLMILPALVYYVFLNHSTSGYYQDWSASVSSMVLRPAFIFQWLARLDSLINPALLILALGGVMLSSPRLRVILIGLWAGYFAYGLTLPRLIITHDYYHIQLIPIVALSLIPLGGLISQRVLIERRVWQVTFAGLVLLVLAFPLWTVRSTLLGQDYRTEADFWTAIGGKLPANGRIIALTQQYGNPLTYYGWKKVSLWPSTQDLNAAELRGEPREFKQLFADKVEGYDFFLITTLNQLERQPQLRDMLESSYPVYDQGGGYLIYDLRVSLDK
jgi:hypothetical protein